MSFPEEKDCEGFELCGETISWYREPLTDSIRNPRKMSKGEYKKARFHSRSCAAIHCSGNRLRTRKSGKVFFIEQTPINNFIYGRS